MSMAQILIIVALWIVAIVPLGATLILFVLSKTGVLATPVEDHYRGPISKVTSLLAFGGWVGLLSIPLGAGLGLAVAGVWIGVLKMQSYLADVSPWKVAGMYWDHLLLIVLSVPAITVIGVALTTIYFGWDVRDVSKKDRAD